MNIQIRRFGPVQTLIVLLCLTAIGASLYEFLNPSGQFSLDDLAKITAVSTTFFWILTILTSAHVFSFPSIYATAFYLFVASVPLLYLWQGDLLFTSWFLFRYDKWTNDEFYLGKLFVATIMGSAALLLGTLIPAPQNKILLLQQRIAARLPARWFYVVSQKLSIALLIGTVVALAALSYFSEGLEQFILTSYAEAYDILHAQAGYILKYGFGAGLFYALTACSSERSIRRKSPFLCLLAASPLLLGDRSGAFEYASAGLAYYASFSYRIKKTEWIRALLVGIAIAIITPFVELARTNPAYYYTAEYIMGNHADAEQDYGLASTATEYRLESDTLPEDFLESFIHPYCVALGVMIAIPDTDNYRWGRDYLLASPALVPMLNGQLTKYYPALANESIQTWFIEEFEGPGGVGTGFLASFEAYRNFGLAGLLGFQLAIGFLLNAAWQLMVTCSRQNPSLQLWLIIVFVGCLNWVRNSCLSIFGAIGYATVLAFILPLLAYWFLPFGKRTFEARRAE
jgi:hypothetical protein